MIYYYYMYDLIFWHVNHVWRRLLELSLSSSQPLFLNVKYQIDDAKEVESPRLETCLRGNTLHPILKRSHWKHSTRILINNHAHETPILNQCEHAWLSWQMLNVPSNTTAKPFENSTQEPFHILVYRVQDNNPLNIAPGKLASRITIPRSPHNYPLAQVPLYWHWTPPYIYEPPNCLRVGSWSNV